MNSADILILTLVGVLALAFLIFAGLALSVRSFTALTELIAQIGSLVGQLLAVNQHQLTTLSDVKESVQNSVNGADTRTMPETAEHSLTEHGDTATK